MLVKVSVNLSLNIYCIFIQCGDSFLKRFNLLFECSRYGFYFTAKTLHLLGELLLDVLDEGVVMLFVSHDGAVSTNDLLTGPAVQLQLFSLVIRAVAFLLQNSVAVITLHEEDHPAADKFCESGLDSQPAVARCVECQDYLCQSCVNMHRRLKKSSGHKIVSLSLVEGNDSYTILEQKRYCSDHKGEELKLYCRTCQEVICRDCAIVTHKQHDYTFIKDVKEELTKKMESLSCEVEAISGAFKEQVESLEKTVSTLNENTANVEGQINTYFDKHIQKLQLHRNALLKKMADKKTTDLGEV